MKKIITSLTLTTLLAISAPFTQAAVTITNNGNTDITLLAYYVPDTLDHLLPGNPIVRTPLAKGQSAQIDYKHAPLGTLSVIGIEGQKISQGTWMAIEEIVKNPNDGDHYTFTQRWIATATPTENRDTPNTPKSH